MPGGDKPMLAPAVLSVLPIAVAEQPELRTMFFPSAAVDGREG